MTCFNNVEELIRFIETSKRVTPKQDLAKMEYYLNDLGNPHHNLPVIHITGTNGKGSTVAFLNSIFRYHNLNVGCFTSPYITKFNERIRYNDEFISDEDLLNIGNKILSLYPKWEKEEIELPSFFELVTLICFVYFKSIKDLDIVLLEVGIGGRLDSTNVVDPLISVITGVSFDHMSLLGNSFKEILNEKLGITKKNKPLFVNIKDDELKEICINKGKELNSNVYFTDEYSLDIKKCDLTGSIFLYNNEEIEIKMLGYHQIENACLAYRVAKYYFENIRSDFEYSKVLLSKGLKNTFWLGRLEIISEDPFIIVDGAHNEEGINKVCKFINNLPIDVKSRRGIVAISDNKDKEKMIEVLDNTFGEIIFTKFNYSRSSTSDTLYSLSNNKNKLIMEDLEEIKEYIYNHSKQLNIFIGSLYFVSEVKKFFNH